MKLSTQIVTNNTIRKPRKKKVQNKVTPKKVKVKKVKKSVKKMKNSITDAYMHCRLNPLSNTQPSTGIPDGIETRRLVVDHRMINNFTFGDSGLINIAITPTIPNSIWCNTGSNADTTWRINGSLYTTNGGAPGIFVPICQPEWRTLGIIRNATLGNYNDVQSLYQSSQFRLVSVGWAITYTGSAMNNGGSIIINSMKLGNMAPTANFGTLSVYSSQSGTNTNYTQGQVFGTEISAYPTFRSANQGTVTVSLAAGAHGILKHSSASYTYKPILNNETYLTAPGQNGVSMLMNVSPTPAQVGISGVFCGADGDWDATLLSVQGTTGQTFMLDTIYCVEYVPTPLSDVFALSQPGPKPRLTSIAKANSIARDLPIAEPGGITNLTNIMSQALSVGKTIYGVTKAAAALAL